MYYWSALGTKYYIILVVQGTTITIGSKRRVPSCYTVRASLAAGVGPLLGPLAPLLELLRRPPASENPVLCVVLGVRHTQLFNAVDELANLFMEQGLLTGVMAPYRDKKELFVPVPSDSTLGIISGRMEQLAATVGVDVQMRMEPFESLGSASEVLDMLLRTTLKFQFQSNGCLQFEKRNQAPQVLMVDEPRSGEVATVAVLSVVLGTDAEQTPVIELECVPKIMMLRTLAEPTDPSQPDYDPLSFTPTSGSVMVMPRLGEGWLVSRYGNSTVSRPAASVTDEPNEIKTQLTGHVKPEKLTRPLRASNKKGFHRYAPETDEEFRRYWLGVHRIRLPADFGGYARISFSSRLELTYPACCIAYQWAVLPRETRAKAPEVIQQFQFLLQQMIGKAAITVSSAHEPPSRTKLLPATGLLPRDAVPRPMIDSKGGKGESGPFKRRLAEDVKEQKVVVSCKKQRSRGNQAKKQKGKSRRVKGERPE